MKTIAPWLANRLSVCLAPVIHHCEPQWSWAPPPFEDYDLWCVLGGEGWLGLGASIHEVGAGTCFLLGPGCSPRGKHDPEDPLRVFACHLDFEERRTTEFLPPVDRPIPFTDLLLLEQLARAAVRGYRLDAQDGAGRAELCLWQMLLALATEPEVSPFRDPRIERCIEALEREPGADWNLQRLARLAGISVTHFARLFTDTVGYPPGKYVIRARVLRAQGLLAESDLPISSIADALGYRDVFFFTRQFRQQTGTSPGEYRKRARL